MAKKIQQKKLLLDNGVDWFFSDDDRFGFPEDDICFAMRRMYELATETKSTVKLKLDITYVGNSYKTKTIASFNPKIL